MAIMQNFKHPKLGEIRVLEIDGAPWFVGKDIAAALGYSDTFGALKKHVDDEDKQNFQHNSFETPRGMTVINENGFYSLAFSSKLPNAKQVKNWIARDVLPILREHNKPDPNDDNTSKSLEKAVVPCKNLALADKITPIEYVGQRVITTELLAMFYETNTDNIKQNFKRNKNKFKEGVHFFLLQGEALRTFKREVTDSHLVASNVNQLYLWTERGASRHCKILDTDKAWEQFDKLEETYFRMRETPRFDASAFPYSQFDVSVFSPEVQLAKTLLESIMRTELEQKRQAAEQERIAQEQARQAEEQKRMADEQERQAAEQKRQAQEQEQHTEALKTVDRKLEDIRDIVVIHPETWRKDCHRLVAAIAQKRGGANAYRDTNAEIFKLLEDRAHVSLKTRLRNRRNRMAEKGIAKSKNLLGVDK